MDKLSRVTIKRWAEADRPREKLLEQGRRALTDAELLAILIGSGSRTESAVDLCRRILHERGNDLNNLSRLSVSELCRYKGIGEAKAISIVAALELGRRRKGRKEEERPMLNNSRRVYEYLEHVYKDLPYEEFWVLFLGGGCKLIAKQLIGKGGNDFTPVDIKQVLRLALEYRATSLVLTHNHPSGSLKPSTMDTQLTNKLTEAAKYFDYSINDHVIFTNSGYYSFRDNGLL
ncbi:DNA repair protein RadC [Parapedobacter sp. ISTM3]|uniref:DNA repair protein RadC n=1 Tax=Parapedobacter luteus TaxID=623280 RepID=A0A1T5E5T1_9SPHI|nr:MULTISPECIES: DNA repair protein RadC [Parapedobacter]MBK1441105.1 DNA repair protein RadC [Parapedobacter sp. ISTM3]SKB79358.1 DNA repair protein RadC [Parapedobacter luteus]